MISQFDELFINYLLRACCELLSTDISSNWFESSSFARRSRAQPEQRFTVKTVVKQKARNKPFHEERPCLFHYYSVGWTIMHPGLSVFVRLSIGRTGDTTNHAGSIYCHLTRRNGSHVNNYNWAQCGTGCRLIAPRNFTSLIHSRLIRAGWWLLSNAMEREQFARVIGRTSRASWLHSWGRMLNEFEWTVLCIMWCICIRDRSGLRTTHSWLQREVGEAPP